MKRRGLFITAAVTLCSVLAAGCSGRTQTETAADVPASSGSLQETDIQDENGVVPLTIWAEETNHELLGKICRGICAGKWSNIGLLRSNAEQY